MNRPKRYLTTYMQRSCLVQISLPENIQLNSRQLLLDAAERKQSGRNWNTTKSNRSSDEPEEPCGQMRRIRVNGLHQTRKNIGIENMEIENYR